MAILPDVKPSDQGMFTGIIEEVGRVRSVSGLGGGVRFRVEARLASELRIDESISVNGACQTVVHAADDQFEVIAIEETLRKTNLRATREGSYVNLERAMKASGRLDGHIVQGHVDATGKISSVEPESASTLYRIRFDPVHAPYLIPVGSIAVDGISLTVARIEGDELTVAIIPHTTKKTAITHNWRPGADVNLEFDLIGKYIVRWLDLNRSQAAGAGRESVPTEITEEMLRSRGF